MFLDHLKNPKEDLDIDWHFHKVGQRHS